MRIPGKASGLDESLPLVNPALCNFKFYHEESFHPPFEKGGKSSVCITRLRQKFILSQPFFMVLFSDTPTYTCKEITIWLYGVMCMNEELDEMQEVQEEPEQKSKKKSDPKLGILMLQFSACLILATMALCIKFFGGEFYTEVRSKYIDMFEDSTTVEEVMSVIRSPSGGDTSSDDGIALTSSDYTQTSSSEGSNSSTETTSSASDGTESASNSSGGTESSVINTAYTFNFNQINQVANLAAVKANSLYTPVVGTVSSEYGYRVNPITGLYALHAGIDIAADTGTPVSCALDGTVRATGDSDSYGLYIIVTHADNMETLYAHLSAINVTEGEMVSRAQTIGLVGSTGNSTGPHLHFEVHVDGKTLNPRYLLTGLKK